MGPLDAADEAARGQAPGRHQISDPLDDARPNISNIFSARASRPTSRRSSARPRFACTSSARRTSIRRRRSSKRMRALVRQAMKEGALGVGSSLIYAPGDLCRDARAGRDHDRGRQMRRHVHQPHAIRGEQAARSDRRADRDQPRNRARRPKSTISSRPGKPNWGKLDAADRQGQCGARAAASGSPPTCTPIPPARRASTPRCRPGSSRAGSRHGSSG